MLMRAVLWKAKPLLHNRRVFTNPQQGTTVCGQRLRQLCRLCFETSSRRPPQPQAHWGVSRHGHGHVYLMIERLSLMDLHRGGSSPLARLPHSQGLTLSKLRPLFPSGWPVLVFPSQLTIRTSSMGNLCRFCACWMLVLGDVSQLGQRRDRQCAESVRDLLSVLHG